MNGIEFNGETYRDDRMFVLYICRCTVDIIEGEIVATTIYHEDAPETHEWCLVTYKNVTRYPAIRVDHFESLKAAQDYMKKVEPTVPLISLGGNSPQAPLLYDQFAKWKAKNHFKEYDYREMYLSGGGNPKEVVYTKKR